MLYLNKSFIVSPDTHLPDFETFSSEIWVMNEFHHSDIDTRADIITRLWQGCHAEPGGLPSTSGACDAVILGIRLYDIMRGAGQSALVRSRINESASQMFHAAVRRQINLEPLDDKIKATLCAMTLAYMKITDVIDELTYLDIFHDDIKNFLAMPSELAKIIPTSYLMDRTLLDTAVQLLVGGREGVLSTSTLLYNPNDHKKPFKVASYLNPISGLWKNKAKEKLKRLIPGQKLMIPVLSTSIHPITEQATNGHFSAILAIKTAAGYKFYIFDSNSSPGMDDKEILIKALTEDKGKHPIFYFQQPFQYHNDCGFHTYNFFKLCIAAPACAFDQHQIMGNIFSNYIRHLNILNNHLYEGQKTTSFLLRLKFAVDCIKNGYTAGLQNTNAINEKLYLTSGSSESVAVQPDSSRSITRWNHLRSSLGNVFSFRRSVKRGNAASNVIELETMGTTGKAELKNIEGQQKDRPD